MRFRAHEETPEVSVDEIAMNPSKIREIADAIGPETRLAVVSGPAGCSKTAAIRALLRQSGRPVREYTESGGSQDAFSVPPDAFGDFLVGCALAPANTVILVDEVPNLSHGLTLEKFRQALEYWTSLPRAPTLVIVFTETEYGSTYGEMLVVSRVFGEILDTRNSEIKHVKCLAISPRFLSKALRGYTNDRALIQELSQLGDVRQALAGLKVPVTGKRDTKTSVFHRIGQVVWASKNINPLNLLDRDEYDQQFDAHVFENYAECGGAWLDIKQFAQCSEYLSIEDAYNPGVSSFALHTILKQASSKPGKFHACVMSQQRQRTIDALDRVAELGFELARVRESTIVSIRDLLLNHSLGLKHSRPMDDIYFSDSDSDSDSS